MSVAILPLDSGARARLLLHHLLENGHLTGLDEAGRAVIQLAVDAWLLEQLMTFDAGSEDQEDGGDDEPDDCPPMLRFDSMPARRTKRGPCSRTNLSSNQPRRPGPPLTDSEPSLDLDIFRQGPGAASPQGSL